MAAMSSQFTHTSAPKASAVMHLARVAALSAVVRTSMRRRGMTPRADATLYTSH